MPTALDPMLDTTALAERWNVSRRFLEKLRAEGCGPPFLRIRGEVRYDPSDVKAFEDAARQTPRSTTCSMDA